MLQISRRTDYAVRIMIELGLYPEGESMPSRQVARKTGVPKAFLHKITADLVKANLVRTFAGPAGGLALALPANEITLLQIIEGVEGPICLNVCLIRPHECPRDQICSAHSLWGRIQTLVVQELQSVSLQQLVVEARDMRQHPVQFRDGIPYLTTG
ncbi:MAG: Rrf2 family transcriptional regulator [Anaerolineales bacterium]|nr:Rrf2 family transcriptional regulator [Anaerolineales bacterium]